MLAWVAAAALSFAGGLALAEEQKPVADRLVLAGSPLGDRSLGLASAPVVVIEFASATCPHCAEFHLQVLPVLKRDYIDTGKVKFIFREFPIDNLALGAFMLARCLPEEKYFSTIDLLFATQRDWAKASNPADRLFEVMSGQGMTRADFDACIKRQDLATAIIEHTRSSAAEFGIKGTPTIFVNGKLVDGHKDMAEVKAAIEAAISE